jgi:putative ABC transport system permease protein
VNSRSLRLRLRWSWRDLRARWLQVAAIALIIGIGSGVYSGLTSVSEWRRTSYDASYAALEMFDLRVELADGAYADADGLVEAVEGIDAAADLDRVEARLTEPTQVDASTADEQVLVPGRMVGVQIADDGPRVGGIEVLEGRALRPADATDEGGVALLVEETFAEDHGIAPGDEIELSGETTAVVVGRALSPENFFVLGDRGGLFAEFAVLYAPIETVQRLADRPGQANDLVLSVSREADRDEVERQIRASLDQKFPDLGYSVIAQEDDPVLRLLYDDIDGDQRFYDIFALLILLGAAFAAFNLTGRIVEAQRREIGIGMALGVTPLRLASRPLLVGVQVALLGVVFGVGVGLLIDSAMADLLESFQPLPAWSFDFQPSVFAQGATLGLLLPLIATVFPVWRAVRVAPVDAISTTHRASGGGLAPTLQRIPLPGSSVAEMPVRNVLREPRRTILTALGIAAAIATLVGVVGMIDTFVDTIDVGDEEILGDAPDRLTVSFDTFLPADAQPVTAITGSPLVRAAETGLTLGGTLAPGDEDEIDVLVSTVDFDSDLWVPTAEKGSLRAGEPGVVLARKAADDLDVGVGDPVTLRHPRREGVAGYGFVETDLPVLAIHPNPYRFLAYVDTGAAGPLFDLEGITNTVQIAPAADLTADEVQRGLFGSDQVASVEPVSASSEAIRERIEEVLGVFAVIQVAVLILTLLIAFNSTAINMDERARENATMFAFGLPVWRVMGVAVTESLLVGVLGTVGGIVSGRLLLEWLIRVLLPQTLPDLGIEPFLSASTVATALALGVVAVALAPLLTLRRLRRMDIPSTLRVME